MEYQKSTVNELYREFQSSENGLSSSIAQEKLKQFGYNELKETKKISRLKIFLSQFTSPVVWILIAAIIISIVVDQVVDAIIIGIILVINALLGYFQEYRAEKAIEALKKVITHKAIVIRDGKELIIEAKELVPGDIIILREGDKIPADARLIEANELKTIEASLTGESTPVKKLIGICRETNISSIFNVVFFGTSIATGTGKAIVVKTGMTTEIGKIAHLLQETETPPTPLQLHLKKLGSAIGVVVVIIAIAVFFLGKYRGEAGAEALLSALALAVAAVPEGLPAVITISLAFGVQRMLKRNALVRKLPSVETLGSCTAICSDKTGTLTKGEMTVQRILVDNKVISVTGIGYVPEGTFSAKSSSLELILTCGTVCNDSQLYKNSAWEIIGDPTEGALVVSASKFGLKKELLNKQYKRIKEIPFTSERKMMSIVCENNKKHIVFTKGAPEVIIKKCKYAIIDGKKKTLDEKTKKELMAENEKFTSNALRVLGFAYKELKKGEKEEENLIFIGLQGMIDPPREEVKLAIQKCKDAGIRTIMITGDHELTAKAIAQQLGIEGKAVSGKDLETINLDEEIESIGVFARVDPKHKLQIVEALQKKGHIVAMTGDGVNDAPALKKANIGIAMGITGTDVAKESSQIVLLDDNFASIVNAIEEGRTIFSNIREFVEYLFSSNIGEVLVIFMGLVLNLPLPLLAVQILWINLLTDGFPALALGVDPAEKGIMKQKPRKQKGIIAPSRWIYIFLIGIFMTFGTLMLYNMYLPQGYAYAQTMAFTTLVVFQLFNVFNLRSTTRSILGQNPFSNKFLVFAVAASFLLQLAVIYSPLAQYFGTVPLQTIDWVFLIVVASSILVLGEITKFIKWVTRTNESAI